MSLSEIILILLIAFMVIKPEQLPEVAYALGRMLQWFRASASKVKGEVNSFIGSIDSATHTSIEHSNERKHG